MLGSSAALVAVSAGLAGCGGGEHGGYRVDAVFDNASNVVVGGDVRVAGAIVGTVVSTRVNVARKAVVTMRIDDPAAGAFRRDASCTIVLQSLIGERFVECRPTQPRPAGRRPPPPLGGRRTIPVTQTASPVDLDVVLGITRLPERERLAIILDELGAGLAGRGEDLGRAIERSVPALRQTLQVVDVLDAQRRTLSRLVAHADRALAPLAASRASLADGIDGLAATTSAVAARRDALGRSLADLPPTLRALEPALADLSRFAGTATPTVRALARAAVPVSRLIDAVPRVGRQARAWIGELGRAAGAMTPAVPAVRSLLGRASAFSASAGGGLADFAALLRAFDDAKGPAALTDLLYNGSGALAAYDRYGHTARSAVIVNTCSTLAVVPSPDCTASPKATAPAPRAAGSGTALLDYLLGR